MKKYILIAGIVILSVGYFALGNKDEESLLPVTFPINSSDIEVIDVFTERGEVYLDVHLIKPLTCSQILKNLEINPIEINGDTYAPACTIINKDLARVVYRESVGA